MGRHAAQAFQEGPKVAIFGREPAAWVAVIEAALTVLAAFGLGLDAQTLGVWVAFVSACGGLATAWLTKDTSLGVVLGVVKAGIAVFAAYGLTLTESQLNGVMLAIPVVFNIIFQRQWTAPAAAPIDPSPPQVTQSPLPPVEEQAA